MRSRRAWAVVVATAVACTTLLVPGVAGARATATPASRAKGGDFAVGRRTIALVDHDRPTAANGTYAGAPDRTLPTLVLYPAKGRPGAATLPDAPPARTGGPYPLVVFSHGFGASGPAYGEVLLRRIAAHGYVVAAPTFPLTNGRAPGGQHLADYLHQPADVSFVITRMLAASKARGDLHGLIDPKEVGAAGHSLGAITTLGVTYHRCCLDHRIKAAVVLAGIQLPFGRSSSWAWPPVPLLLVHGTSDRTVPYAASTATYRAAKPPKFLLTLQNAPHTPFGSPYLDVIVNSTNDFLDRYLRDQKHALVELTLDANVPGASSLQADPR